MLTFDIVSKKCEIQSHSSICLVEMAKYSHRPSYALCRSLSYTGISSFHFILSLFPAGILLISWCFTDIQLIHNVSSWITLNCILSKFETRHNNLESSSDIAISTSPCTPTSYFTYPQPTRHLAIQSRWISTTLFTFTSILLVL